MPLTRAPRGRRSLALLLGAAVVGSVLMAPSAASAAPHRITASAVSIVGSAIVGQKLTAKTRAWGPGRVALRYQWLRAGRPIKHATMRSYTLMGADAGARISVRVTGVKRGYAHRSKRSARTAVVAPVLADTLEVHRGDDGIVTAMFIGDSLTAGFFATTRSAAFPALVEARVGDVTEVQASSAHQSLSTVSGITTVPLGVELAVVELGTNDVGLQTPLADFRSQYRDLLGKILAASPAAAIVCTGTWTGWGWDYDAIIADECTAAGGRYVDLNALFVDPANRGPAGLTTGNGTSDDFHPNDTGHARIADALLARITVD